jgi:hypothetical protein
MRLHDQVTKLKEEKTLLLDGLHDLKLYLMSAKFHSDTNVQVGDVLLRLQELDNAVWLAEVEG